MSPYKREQEVKENEEIQKAEGAEEVQYEVDPIQLERYMKSLRDEQNLAMGVVGGTAAAVLGAIAWAGITYATDTKFGLVVLLIGLMVGYAVRFSGKGLDTSFGVMGAILALVGCIGGNILVICVYVAKIQKVPIMKVVMNLNLDVIITLLQKTFSPMDLLFYGIAIYEGYRLSFRKADEDKLASMLRPIQPSGR